MQNWKAARSGVSVSSVRSNRARTCIIASVVGLAFLGLLIVTEQEPQALHSAIKRSLRGDSYNYTYPFSYSRMLNGETYMPISIIADLDHDSKHKEGYWFSYLLHGHLIRLEDGTYRATWQDQPLTLKSYFAEKGRGCELSDLQAWNGHLYSVDDRTGIVYQITEEEAIPRYILTDGDGTVSKGFKAEWMTVKDERLWIGGMGKEWTTPDGEVVNLWPQWVKAISATGHIEHINWVDEYNALRLALSMPAPGYAIHESAVWSNIHKKWFFLPRKASKLRYQDTEDERRCANSLLITDEHFSSVQVVELGPLNPILGFSSFKFIPNTNDQEIVALKTQEYQGEIATYIAVFRLDGTILMNITEIGQHKYEGIEFI